MALNSCIEACRRCADQCDSLCKSEQRQSVHSSLCLPLANNCSQFCRTTAGFMERGSRFVREIAGLCAEICDACIAECEAEHNQIVEQCVASCRNCANECRRVLADLPT
jgi:hypothetical protein